MTVIEGQGIDPFAYLVLPRVLGFTLCAICLTLFFITASMARGLSLWGMDWNQDRLLSEFATSVLAILKPADVINLLLKSTIPSLICCLYLLPGRIRCRRQCHGRTKGRKPCGSAIDHRFVCRIGIYFARYLLAIDLSAAILFHLKMTPPPILEFEDVTVCRRSSL